jgi:hypothetical protein
MVKSSRHVIDLLGSADTFALRPAIRSRPPAPHHSGTSKVRHNRPMSQRGRIERA